MQNDKLASGGTAAPAEPEGVRQPNNKQIADAIIAFLASCAVKYHGYIATLPVLDDDGEETEEEQITFDGRFKVSGLISAIRSAVEPSTAGRSAAPPEAKESEQEGA